MRLNVTYTQMRGLFSKYYDFLSLLSDEPETDGFSDDSNADKTWQPLVANKMNDLDDFQQVFGMEVTKVSDSDLNVDYFAQTFVFNEKNSCFKDYHQ